MLEFVLIIAQLRERRYLDIEQSQLVKTHLFWDMIRKCPN